MATKILDFTDFKQRKEEKRALTGGINLVEEEEYAPLVQHPDLSKQDLYNFSKGFPQTPEDIEKLACEILLKVVKLNFAQLFNQREIAAAKSVIRNRIQADYFLVSKQGKSVKNSGDMDLCFSDEFPFYYDEFGFKSSDEGEDFLGSYIDNIATQRQADVFENLIVDNVAYSLKVILLPKLKRVLLDRLTDKQKNETYIKRAIRKLIHKLTPTVILFLIENQDKFTNELVTNLINAISKNKDSVFWIYDLYNMKGQDIKEYATAELNNDPAAAADLNKMLSSLFGDNDSPAFSSSLDGNSNEYAKLQQFLLSLK